MSLPLTIIGAGPMAEEYAKILKSMDVPFEVVGRGEASCKKFEETTGHKAIPGGFEKWLAQVKEVPSRAIVAVSEENLGSVVQQLLTKNCASILVEKPGGATFEEVAKLAELSKAHQSKVFVGYNRRFYASAEKAKELIAEDGGVDSFFFEFTEWSHVIEKKVCPSLVKEEWLWHNSTHVMDLAFYLGGFPSEIAAYKGGTLTWHPSGSKYSGSGKTEQGALFSYMANWAAPGRWVVEVLTKNRRFIFKPLEKLQVQKIGSVAVEEIPLENKVDIDFKAGLHRQVQAFLSGDSSILPTLEDQARNMKWFQAIAKGQRV